MHSGSFHGELVQQRINDLHREANQARLARQARPGSAGQAWLAEAQAWLDRLRP